MDDLFAPQDPLRHEIAMAAARLIAEEGYDHASARHKATRSILGNNRLPKERAPSDLEIDNEIRAWHALFRSDTQPEELHQLRQAALSLMRALEDFEPILYGSAVNGTANKLSDLHVLAFADDPKEIDYWLLNQGLTFEACEDAHLAGKNFPAVGVQWQNKWVQLGSAEMRHRRGLLKKAPKDEHPFQTDLAGLQKLLNQTNADS